MTTKPIWVWLPNQTTPTLAGEVSHDGTYFSVAYTKDFAHAGVAIDPIALRLGVRAFKSMQLAGVIEDAKPSGYGQDQLNAKHAAHYGRDLTALELLEEGAGDAVGAIAVCEDIAAKQNWIAPTLGDLVKALQSLEDRAPASRAIRMVNQDVATSAGGERPKITISDQGCLWLAKMQDRGDRAGMPALEHTAMMLASQVGIHTPDVRLVTVQSNQVFLVRRFDRAGSVTSPTRTLFASAHSVLRLAPAAVRGDPRRSYLDFASEMKRWGNVGRGNQQSLDQLWRRIAVNALMGNIDDHARNHGLLLTDGTWELSPAFDITPIRLSGGANASPYPSLAMAITLSGSCEASPENLLTSAKYFGVEIEDARQFLLMASQHIASHWECDLRRSLAPLSNQPMTEQIVGNARGSFAMAEYVAQTPDAVNAPADALTQQPARSRRQRDV